MSIGLFSRSTGKINSSTGSQYLSNIPKPVLFIGIDLETSQTNFCNVTVHDGANTNAALYFAHCHGNDYMSYDLHIPVRSDYGIWLEIAGGNGSNIIVRYM